MVALKTTLKHGIVHVNIQSSGGETFRNMEDGWVPIHFSCSGLKK
jgi:hypothetical protein